MDKLKIGTICFYYPHLGGSGIMASRIAKQLSLEGNRSVVISYDDTSNPPEMEQAGVYLYRAQNVNYEWLKSKPNTEALSCKVLDAIQKEGGLDVVHSHYLIPHSIVGNIVKQISGVPHVITAHGSDMHTAGDNPGLKEVLRWSLENADAVTFVSDYLRRKCENIFGTDFGGKVIPNFVDTILFNKARKNGLRKELGVPEDAIVISHASNFRPVKDVYSVGLAARRLMQDKGLKDRVYFFIAGDSSAPDYIRLKQDIDYVGLSERFRFLGKQETIAPMLAESDIALLTSHREGCPLFVLEALASEVPVVSSSIGGVPEIINSGQNGLLYDAGDSEGLIHSLHFLIENPNLRESMGRRGLQTIVDKFSKETVMGEYKSIYEMVRK